VQGPHGRNDHNAARLTRAGRLLAVGAAAAAVWAPSAAAAEPPVSLPWPPTVLPHVPPLAPETSGVLPLPPRFFRQLSNRERIVVRLDEDGKPHSVRVLQTIVLKRLGDYVLTIPAPVLSVDPGPETESQPGQRENQILWEGFSPGRRVLAAWADLRVAESVAGLPVEVNVEPGEITVRNATAVTVPSFTADPVPASIDQVSRRVRTAVKANVFAEGLTVALLGKQTPEQLRVAAPLRVRGTVRVSGERVPFSGLLDGLRRPELRVPIPDGDPKLEMRVQAADIDLPRPAQDPRSLLAQTIRLELTYARKRQFDQFLASPDQTGPSSAIYIYRTSPPLRPETLIPYGEEEENHTVGWIVLGLGLAAALPVAAVVWAHS
jgi:hypothetical protein